MVPTGNRINTIVAAWAAFLSGDVFYLPVLGPVYAGSHSIKSVLRDVLTNGATGAFLPYDKNKRWFNVKQDRIALRQICLTRDWLVIPVRDRLSNKLKVFCYGNVNPHSVATRCGILGRATFYVFGQEHAGQDRRQAIYLKIIDSGSALSKPDTDITPLSELASPAQSILADLGNEPELEGFSFLARAIAERKTKPSSVICAINGNTIIGAIGPIDVAADAWGDRWLLPAYFGVKREFRKMGYGEKLWKTAMSEACKNGARYALVQNRPSSPAARFYKAQGLTEALIYSIADIELKF